MLDAHMVVEVSTFFSCNLVAEELPRFFDYIVKVFNCRGKAP
jgi:hypothetical protein